MGAGMRIGELAKAAGVGVETLRFYERKGLLDPPPRRASGYRQYPAAALDRLGFIREAKAVGFTLAEIGELLSLDPCAVESCGAVRASGEARLAELDRRLAQLQDTRARLARVLARCDPGKPCDFLPGTQSLPR